jgi:hypothetical protein
MPFTRLPFDPPPLSNLRERLLQKQAKRAAELESKARQFRELQATRTTRLSPSEARLNEQYINMTLGASQRLRDSIEAVRLQDEAERKTEQQLKELDPLSPGAKRFGFHRSSKDRNAAIAGILQRERKSSVPLTREAYARAKATAAARRLYSDEGGLRGARGYSYVVRPWEAASYRSDYVSAWSEVTRNKPQVYSDPCVERKIRQQVMIAKGLNRGWKTRKRRTPFSAYGC